jgi:two-component system, OmpR family, phosphate regulon sensor histidine kinase PhoR
MFVLDLRWLLFGLLTTLIVAGLLAAWLERRRPGWRGTPDPGGEQVWAVLEQAPVGLLLLDGSGAYRYANLQARQLLGLAGLAGLLPEEAWVSRLAEDRQAARQDPVGGSRYRSVMLAPDRSIRWWITPWEDLAAGPGQSRDLIILLDATAQQRTEQAAGRLLSDLSHELRTPLATILTHLEVLLLPDLSTELGQQSLHMLKAEGRRMARLVNDMLELGRLETRTEIERRPVDLLGIVEQIVAQMTPLAQERGMKLALEAVTPLPLVVGDEYRLRQAFLNLVDNGIKHCRPGDRVVVSLRQEPGGLACAVCDDGPGIPAQHLPHITQRFYRSTPQGEGGSGLGLSLVAEILRRHGSGLEIDSRAVGDDTGTDFRFLLPVLPGEEADE